MHWQLSPSGCWATQHHMMLVGAPNHRGCWLNAWGCTCPSCPTTFPQAMSCTWQRKQPFSTLPDLFLVNLGGDFGIYCTPAQRAKSINCSPPASEQIRAALVPASRQCLSPDALLCSGEPEVTWRGASMTTLRASWAPTYHYPSLLCQLRSWICDILIELWLSSGCSPLSASRVVSTPNIGLCCHLAEPH